MSRPPVTLIQLDPTLLDGPKAKEIQARLHPGRKKQQFFVTENSLQALQGRQIPLVKLKSFKASEIPVRIAYPYRSQLFSLPSQDAVHEVLAYAMSRFPGKRRVQVHYLGRHPSRSKKSFVLDRPGGGRSYQWEISASTKKPPEMRDRFPKMIERIRDPHTKVILSLGSGGIRLFAHTAIMKFIELLGLNKHIREIWGSSGGAVAGLLYSVGVEPATIEQEGFDLYNERYSIQFSPKKLDVLKNLLFDSLFRRTDNLLKGFLDCQKSLQALLQKHLTDRKKRIPFFCIAYNLKKRRNEVLTPERVKGNFYPTPIFHTDALDAVIASSSIPIVYVPKRISRGHTQHEYIDGGTTEEVPLLTPFRKWLADRSHKRERTKKLLIIAVNLFPQVGTLKIFNHWFLQKMPLLRLLKLSAGYVDLIRQARIDEHKEHLARDKKVTLWELSLPLPGASVLDPKQIPEIIETAKHSFLHQLVAIEKKLT